jgi:Domain of unknown function (DUF4234)/Short C-terminal domain
VASTVVISGSHNTAKIRNPWGVLGLSIITFGIYHLFWWYYINREMRDYGIAKQRDLGKSPTSSLLAYWFGWVTLYIATVWTIVATTQRIKQSQQVAGVQDQQDGIVAALLWVFTLGLGATVYMQYQLNKVWETPGETTWLLSAGGAGPVGNSDLDRLKQLTELKESGALSDEEFQAEKTRLGFGGQPASNG